MSVNVSIPRRGSISAIAHTAIPAMLLIVCANPDPICPHPISPTAMGFPSACRFFSLLTSSNDLSCSRLFSAIPLLEIRVAAGRHGPDLLQAERPSAIGLTPEDPDLVDQPPEHAIVMIPPHRRVEMPHG